MTASALTLPAPWSPALDALGRAVAGTAAVLAGPRTSARGRAGGTRNPARTRSGNPSGDSSGNPCSSRSSSTRAPAAARFGQIRTMAAVPDKTPFADRTDEALLTASIDGDRGAFAALVERYRDELLHFLIRFLGSRSAADDVFQEAFLQVHLSARSFDATRRFKPWLFTIAANKARDHFRRNHRQPPLSLSATMEKGGDSERFVDLLAADQAGPEAPLGDAERSSLVRRIVDQMPPHHREILLLSYFQRMSYNQIADCLSIPLGTVKSRLHAAVANFAGAWRASHGNDAGEAA